MWFWKSTVDDIESMGYPVRSFQGLMAQRSPKETPVEVQKDAYKWPAKSNDLFFKNTTTVSPSMGFP